MPVIPVVEGNGVGERELVASVLAVASRSLTRPDAVVLARTLLHRHGPPLWGRGAERGAWVAGACQRWARSIRYVREPYWLGELVVGLEGTHAAGAGDCDDIAASVATLAGVVGVPVCVGVIPMSAELVHVVACVADGWDRSTGPGDERTPADAPALGWLVVDGRRPGLSVVPNGVRWWRL
jgi:hypothetical protein